MKTMTHEEWMAEAERLFPDKPGRHYFFICPRCGVPQSGQDFLDLGMDSKLVRGYLAFSCIGRFTDEMGCDWSLGGLLPIHKLEVSLPDGETRPTFEFYEGPTKGREFQKLRKQKVKD